MDILLKEIDETMTSKLDNKYVNDAVVESATLISRHIQGVLDRLTWVENGTVVPHTPAASSSITRSTSNSLHMTTMMLVDNDGLYVMTLGDLVFKCKMLGNQITTLWVGVSAQGGIIFGTHAFASEKTLLALVCSSRSSLL